MRLGRLPSDPQAIAAAPQLHPHRFAAAAPPATLDRSAIPFAPALWQNDTLPDCSAVGLANAACAVAWALGGYDLAIEGGLVPEFYAETIGMPHATDAELAATDGAVLLDALALQARTGFDVGSQRLTGLFGALPVRRDALANAMAHLGHAYLGVTLHAQDMTLPAAWTLAGPRDVVGGHCVMAWDYTGLGDDDTVRVGTWGTWQRATWAWVEARAEEAWGLVWRQLAPAAGGVDVALLEAELAAMA